MAFDYLLKLRNPSCRILAFLLVCILISSVTTATIKGTNEGENNETNYLEKHSKFESLLAGGRTLAFPFATGLLLTLVSKDRTNWNISQNGLEKVLGVSESNLVKTYSSLLQELKQDENVTLSTTIYALHEGWNSSTELLSKLDTNVTEALWDNLNANKTWDIMNNNVVDSTNGKLDGKLIPRDGKVGTPFPFSTKSTLISTFHYKSDWQEPWSDGGLKRFHDSGNVPFVTVKGEYLVSEEEDFTAVKIPLEGEGKSFVLVVPKINITKYFRLVTARSDADENEEEDAVPFPKNWQKQNVSMLVPTLNLTTSDQYGKELGELGMNETFCTTLHDRVGKIPYYLRPIVQVNTIEFTGDSLELASATGTAVEKFHFGLDVGGKGYPKLSYKSQSELAKSTDESATTLDPNANLEIEASPTTSTTAEDQAQNDKTPFIPIIVDRPFLWYLTDEKIGPIFYGVIQKVESTEETLKKDEDESDKLSQQLEKDEIEKFILWSCRSFKQSGDLEENSEN